MRCYTRVDFIVYKICYNDLAFAIQFEKEKELSRSFKTTTRHLLKEIPINRYFSFFCLHSI